MTQNQTKERRGLVSETGLFLFPGIFFWIVAVAYALVADAEPIGTMVFVGLGFMFFFVSGFLWLTSRRVDFRPSDNEEGNIDEAEGEYGEFNSSSWWPLVVGVASALVAAGFAVGWWMFGLGLVVSAIGAVGYALENNRGHYSH
ncbi:MAG: cytochrome c oxidase subunit 4 [Flaviflexus sp.]|uniref:aa3-type cytochrome oxidase subunit IV n=1 Tax=Flaviflexus sp. TaxID=1969482 RepID=UPI00352D76A7